MFYWKVVVVVVVLWALCHHFLLFCFGKKCWRSLFVWQPADDGKFIAKL